MALKRQAVTLLELLVVIGILAVLLALLLPTVQKVRLAAERASNINSVKQALLATHNYGDARGNAWPSVNGNRSRIDAILLDTSVVNALCPFLEADPNHPPALVRFGSDPSRQFSPPEDPLLPPPPPPPGVPVPPGGATLAPLLAPQQRVTSWAFNPLVYVGKQLSVTVLDGASNTIAITEHYGFCDGAAFDWGQVVMTCYDYPSMQQVPCSSSSLRRSTFADYPMFQDVRPVTSQTDAGVQSVGNLPLTFQVQPLLNQCDPRIPQSSSPGGILCGLADGSVRFVSQNVGSNIFWGSVTPNKGEVVILE